MDEMSRLPKHTNPLPGENSEIKPPIRINAISIPDGATNGDMVEKIFGNDIYYDLIRMMYSSCCKKLKDWWDSPYEGVKK